MANVFIAMYNFGRDPNDFYKMPPFLESFLNGFKDAGNNVLCFRHKTYGREFDEKLPKEYESKIKRFNPDLCILFCNNFWDISYIVNCPIVIYDIDSVLEFKGINHLCQNIDRYLFVINQTLAEMNLKKHLGVLDKQICYIPFFSEVKNDSNAIVTTNINFLGSNWLWMGCNFIFPFINSNPSIKDKEIARNVLNYFIESPFMTSDEIVNVNEWHPQIPLEILNSKRAAVEISGIRRLRYLTSIADLGCEIRGAYWTIDCMKYFPELALNYNPKLTLSLKENQDFYNSAKISLNTKHIQAQNGFSFRICDIMASNACLVTEYCSDLRRLFPKIPLPMFTSEIELQECCKKILVDEKLRLEIVEASHEVIDSSHRFKHVLQKLEEFTGLNLRTNSNGVLTFFSDEEIALYNEDCKKDSSILPMKIKKHLGYCPADIKRTKYIKLGNINVLRYIKTEKGIIDIYFSFLPLVRIFNTTSYKKIKLLLLEKLKTFCKNQNILTPIYIKSYLSKPAKFYHRQHLKRKIRTGKKIRVVLFVSRISCWLFTDLYDLLLKSNIFDPYIVIKPFVSQGKDAMIRYQETTYKALKECGYDPIRGYDIEKDSFFNVRKEINPDIIFYTKFWKPHFHPNFYIDKFLDKLTFLTPYGFYIAEDRRAMNFELNNLVDGFFLETDFHKEMAQRDMDNKGKNVYITGAPKLDLFFNPTYVPKDVWKEQTTRKKRIIWAPHHEDKTPKWMYQFDAFYEIADAMLDIADYYQDCVQFAFKPHPMLKEKLYIRWGKENTDSYYQKWKEKENCQLEEGEFEDLFILSDAMILDSISFIAEYTAVNKPALFTIGRNARVFLNEYGQKNFEVLYKAKENLKEEIYHFIDDVVLNGNDSKSGERKAFINAYLKAPNNRTASQNIFDNMCKIINK